MPEIDLGRWFASWIFLRCRVGAMLTWRMYEPRPGKGGTRCERFTGKAQLILPTISYRVRVEGWKSVAELHGDAQVRAMVVRQLPPVFTCLPAAARDAITVRVARELVYTDLSTVDELRNTILSNFERKLISHIFQIDSVGLLVYPIGKSVHAGRQSLAAT